MQSDRNIIPPQAAAGRVANIFLTADISVLVRSCFPYLCFPVGSIHAGNEHRFPEQGKTAVKQTFRCIFLPKSDILVMDYNTKWYHLFRIIWVFLFLAILPWVKSLFIIGAVVKQDKSTMARYRKRDFTQRKSGKQLLSVCMQKAVTCTRIYGKWWIWDTLLHPFL